MALLGLALTAPVSRAEVVIQAPFITVAFGRPGKVFLNLDLRGIPLGRKMPPPPVVVPPGPVAPVPPPTDELPPPRPVEPSVAPPPPPPPAPAAFTVAEFAAGFKPCAGTHQVVLIHPLTGQPVPVQFTLPPGIPKKVRVERRELEFDYGKREVEIRFYRNGSVKVEYN
jgi:hypothetical protein